MSVPIIELKNLSCSIAGKSILAGLSLAVDKGALVLVEGATGCGKTTLINILTGLQKMTAGFGRTLGFDLPGIPPVELASMRRKMGIVFQSPHFLDQETVLTNVSLPLAIAGASRSECRSRGTRALMDAGLTSQARRFPSQLSGGERARLQIARALIHGPFLLLADEPFAHLDSESASAAEKLLAKAHERGATILVTTHQSTRLSQKALRYSLENGTLYPC